MTITFHGAACNFHDDNIAGLTQYASFRLVDASA
jgi:hypothetical protein